MHSRKKSTVIVISHTGMSNASPELSKTLLFNYLNLLIEEDLIPNALLIYGEGVKTIIEDSPFIDSYVNLERAGAKVIACKTCLNFYGISDKVKVGSIGTMADIMHYQWEVEKVINL